MRSKPLQFIRLSDSMYKSTNLDPTVAMEYYHQENNNFFINYRPDLIIYLGSTIYDHRTLFMLHGAYPRVLPFYHHKKWNQEPETIPNPNFEKGSKNLKTLKIMVELYITLKSGGDLEWKDKQVIKKLHPMYPHEIIPYKFLRFLDDINEDVLLAKYYNYFQKKDVKIQN